MLHVFGTTEILQANFLVKLFTHCSYLKLSKHAHGIHTSFPCRMPAFADLFFKLYYFEQTDTLRTSSQKAIGNPCWDTYVVITDMQQNSPLFDYLNGKMVMPVRLRQPTPTTCCDQTHPLRTRFTPLCQNDAPASTRYVKTTSSPKMTCTLMAQMCPITSAVHLILIKNLHEKIGDGISWCPLRAEKAESTSKR